MLAPKLAQFVTRCTIISQLFSRLLANGPFTAASGPHSAKLAQASSYATVCDHQSTHQEEEQLDFS